MEDHDEVKTWEVSATCGLGLGNQSLLVYRALEINLLRVQSKSGPHNSQALALERLKGKQACHDGSYLPGSSMCFSRKLPYRVPSPHPLLLRVPQALQGAPSIWGPLSPRRVTGSQGLKAASAWDSNVGVWQIS